MPRITPGDQDTFLAAIHSGATIEDAAEEAGHTPSSFYRLRQRDRGFSDQFDEASRHVPLCPVCNSEMAGPASTLFKSWTVRHSYDCPQHGLLFGERIRDFELEDQGAEISWGPILWDLGVIPMSNPFAEAA